VAGERKGEAKAADAGAALPEQEPAQGSAPASPEAAPQVVSLDAFRRRPGPKE
jgi:hypothetical protein